MNVTITGTRTSEGAAGPGEPSGTRHLVVMGVSGCGKTTLARALSAATGMRFLEADDLHPQENVAKMAAGVPLDDDDRWPWLGALSRWMHERAAADESTVITCSALKRTYRDLLAEGLPGVTFVHLVAEPTLIGERLQRRSGHYMPASLLDSQLADLEALRADENGVVLDASQTPDDLVAATLAWLDRQDDAVGRSSSETS